MYQPQQQQQQLGALLPAHYALCTSHRDMASVVEAAAVLTPSHTPTAPTTCCWCDLCTAGKTIVPAGGACAKPDGSWDIMKVCVATHPVCKDGRCVSLAESGAATPSPPSPTACASFANLGEACNTSQGKCCGESCSNCRNYEMAQALPGHNCGRYCSLISIRSRYNHQVIMFRVGSCHSGP